MILEHEKARWLSPAKQKWIEDNLHKWGAWEFDGIDHEIKTNMIYRFMKSVEGQKLAEREMCCDDFGLLVNGVIHTITKSKKKDTIQLRKYLECKYVYGISERKIAIQMSKNDDCKRGIRHWQDIVTKALRESERLIADILGKAIENHPKRIYFQKYAFKG